MSATRCYKLENHFAGSEIVFTYTSLT